ncbi:MAG: ABC transporter ATP-binding protein [Clostridia bacterium]|nr:ABC transporter ATP-binding protein [Clostridia bacterium]
MIRFNNLSVSYGRNTVLNGITSCIPGGEFTCILGKNGSGKSTLLRATMGLIPYKGEISLAGAPLEKLPAKSRARKIAYLPQNYPVPNIDVRSLISCGRFPHTGFAHRLSPSDESFVQDAARETCVEHLMERMLPSLSGGERQRAYLAMVIAQNADTILLDEPASSLDIAYQAETVSLLSRLHRRGKTIAMVAHDLPQAFSCATHIMLLESGSIRAEGSPGEMWNHPGIRDSFGVGLAPSESSDSFYRYHLVR